MAAIRKPDPQNDYIPTSYDDLHRYYFAGGNSLSAMLIRRMMPHATEDERESLGHDVFLRLIEKDMLAKFNPEKGNFGGVIFFTTRSIVVNHLERKGRNPLTGRCAGSLVEVDVEQERFEPGVYNINRLFATPAPQYEGQIDARDLVRRLVEWASETKANARNKRDQSMLQLIELMAEEHDTKECAEALGVTVSTVFNWIKVLRDKVTELQVA